MSTTKTASTERTDAMTTATASAPKLENMLTNDLDDGVLLRLLALAMDKVQRRRRQPKKPGRLHRV